ncbi:hypothetical protein GJ496_000385 [Pomphorhynchus laevis]|nr:hypothetical protein GJ496_000385 [Pomphorhynchus laevis]
MHNEWRWRRYNLEGSVNHFRSCHGHKSIVVNDLLISFFGGNEEIFNQIYTLDVVNHKWQQIPTCQGDIPRCCVAFGLANLDCIVYLFAGTYEYETFSNDLYELDTVNWTWKKHKPIESTPSPRIGHSLDGFNNKLYLFGGRTSDRHFTNEYFVYNKKSWNLVKTNTDQAPPPRCSHSSVIFNGDNSNAKLIIFGGNAGSNRLNDLYFFMFETYTWIEVECGFEGIPSPRSCHTASIVNNQMIVFGGWTQKSSDNKLYCTNTTYMLNPEQPMWEQITANDNDYDEVPQPRAGHSSLTYCNRFFVINGRTNVYDDVCLSDVWCLDSVHPCSPTNLTVVSVSENSARLQWTVHGCADIYLLQIMRLEEEKDSKLKARRTKMVTVGIDQQCSDIYEDEELTLPDKRIKVDNQIRSAVSRPLVSVNCRATTSKGSGPTIVRIVNPSPSNLSALMSNSTGQQIINLSSLASNQPLRFRVAGKDGSRQMSTPRIINLTNALTKKIVITDKNISDNADTKPSKDRFPPQLDGIYDDTNFSESSIDTGWFDVGAFRSNSCIIFGYYDKFLDVHNSVDYHVPEVDTFRHKLLPRCNYVARVFAVNAIGLSEPSTPVKFHTCSNDITDIPLNLRCCFRDSDKSIISVQWDPIQNKNEEIIEYALYVAYFKSDVTKLKFQQLYCGSASQCYFQVDNSIAKNGIERVVIRLAYRKGDRFGPVIETNINID